MLFGRFVGSWDVDAALFDPEGRRREMRAEWHFGWVLDGRAVQDVLVSPGVEHGTTLRFYDPAMGAWRIVFITPVDREVHELTARAEGADIVLEGRRSDDGRPLRWTFFGIEPDSFVWRGEVSSDGGASWFVDQEMRARRSA